MRLIKLYVVLISLLSIFSLAACDRNYEPIVPKENVLQEENPFELAIKQKNAELDHTKIKLTTYANEIEALLTQPAASNFAVNERLTIEGTIVQHDKLTGNYAWIKVLFHGETLTDNTQHAYVPIIDGKFKHELTLANGKGEYDLTVLLPSKDEEKYYYDLAQFTVFNVNPRIHRDIAYSAFAQDAELTIQDPHSAFIDANHTFTLTGEVNLSGDQDTVMLELTKDDELWKHVITVKDGQFTYDVPLFYGKGVHELRVYVPDLKRDHYYQEGTLLYINNTSDLITEPIKYMSTYEARGVNLVFPTHSGDEAELTYRLKGAIDQEAPFAKETTHIYITTKKNGEEALDVIPVNDYRFDDEFYVRFGPGTYDVIVSVPEIKDENSDIFYYSHVAEFSLTSIATADYRDTLPSRGVESDAPEIKMIANELINDTMSERNQAKAVYEYTAKNIAYDVDKLRNNSFEWDDSALKTLRLGTGVCQDYAYLAIAILRAAGMEARYVAGTAESGLNFARHAWVEVNIDGKWITMDPTWGAGYIHQDEFIPKYTEAFFDPDEEAFKTHSRIGIEY